MIEQVTLIVGALASCIAALFAILFREFSANPLELASQVADIRERFVAAQELAANE
jgi:hypothetical protein